MIKATEVPEFIQQVTVGNIITWIALLSATWLLLKRIGPIVKKLSDTLDDFHGERARPGVKARPGIMERLGDQDVTLNDIQSKVVKMSNGHIAMLNSMNELKERADQNQKGIQRNRKDTRRVETMLLQHIHESQIWIADLGRNAEHYNFRVPDWPVRQVEYIINHDDDEEDGPDPAAVQRS